jgi:hypothetical protein
MDSGNSNRNSLVRVMRIFLFGQREKEGRLWGSAGSQVWGPTIGEWRREQKWPEKRYEKSEVICL